ncbi:MAG: NHL repeat-containing protein [Treponema sp.]|nr:NHL repeat-containing protein [Treponema sp.]
MMFRTKNTIRTLSLITILLGFCFPVWAQADGAGLIVPSDRIRTAEEGLAGQEFRRGVQAYYRCAYNEAIMQFEKALSYLPTDNLILDWLGKAYYKSGLEGSALSYWETAGNEGYGGLLLKNKIEIVKERRVTGALATGEKKDVRISESGSFDGNYQGNLVFSGPLSVLPNPDGTFWVVTYNENLLILMNQSGQVIDRKTGPVNGFDRPVDIIRLKDGNLLVSESAGDRLALLNKKGNFIRYIGSKGRGLGQMVGPQYLAQDKAGNIYVSDYGNRRIDVFDSDGNPLFFFGGKQGDFAGVKGPTGIYVIDDSVFVADDHKGCIYEFDRSGNYVRLLCENKTFSKPESIRMWNNRLLVCDVNRVIGINYESGSLFEYGKTGNNNPSRLNTAVADINSNLVVTDFKANEIYMMSEIQELVGGMFVQIDNVNADKFPQVTVEVKVENRHRQPVVGLNEQNFYLSENKRNVSGMKLIGAAYNNTYTDITFIIDRSIQSSYFTEQIDSSLREIASAMENRGIVRIISAGRIPVTEYEGDAEGCKDFSSTGLKTPVSSEVALDLALRLAANELVNGNKKRAIVLLTAGNVTNGSFGHYNLAELAAFLNNNAINLAVVKMSQGALSAEVNYLVENTSGEQYFVFRPEGLKPLVQDLIDIPQGVYQLSYVSALPTNYGENYLPLEVEVYMLNRSGRDESGYFAPLE